jgi:hypothetical protein
VRGFLCPVCGYPVLKSRPGPMTLGLTRSVPRAVHILATTTLLVVTQRLGRSVGELSEKGGRRPDVLGSPRAILHPPTGTQRSSCARWRIRCLAALPRSAAGEVFQKWDILL